MPKKKLTDKQRKFIKEYLIDLNATQAAIRAGYSEKTARFIGNENLTKPYIQVAIQKEFKKIEEQTGLTVKWVLDGFQEVADRCMQRVPVMYFDKAAKEYKQEVDENGEGVWTFQAMGANKALENIGRHLGMFNDKLAISNINSLDSYTEDELTTALEEMK